MNPLSTETEVWRTWPTPALGTTLSRWQANRCAWCGYEDQLVRDHCHQTGLVRGLLCRSCNQTESSDFRGDWNAWRAGDHAARAAGHFEVYTNHLGQTPLRPTAALVYYTGTERDAWWEKVITDLRAGSAWPVEAPWSEFATARRDSDMAEMRAAIGNLGSALLGGDR